MFEYINGKVTIIESGYIVIDNNGIGYKIFVGSPYSFNIDEEYKVYLYQNIREDENTLFGFSIKVLNILNSLIVSFTFLLSTKTS